MLSPSALWQLGIARGVPASAGPLVQRLARDLALDRLLDIGDGLLETREVGDREPPLVAWSSSSAPRVLPVSVAGSLPAVIASSWFCTSMSVC
jgi:hypothetical protein